MATAHGTFACRTFHRDTKASKRANLDYIQFHKMEYTVIEMLEKLGGLVNKIQRVRNKIPVDMKAGDARHVCLSGIQTSIEPVMLAMGAIETANQCIPDIELSKVSGLKNRTNQQQLDTFDTWAKVTLLTFVHFRIENMLLNLLSALDSSQSGIRGFDKLVTGLFARITISDREEKKDCLKVMSVLRNSLHNNSVNRNASIDKTINGRHFEIIENKNTQATIFDIIFLIDYSIDIIESIINSEEILKLPTPIPDQFHLNLGS
jgi:hypothetical protein